MLQMKIDTGGRVVTPGDLPSILGAQRAYRELGDMIEALITQMDLLTGDPDLEPNGDELDGTMGEDDFCQHSDHWLAEPGCPVSDPGEREAITCPDYGIDQSSGPINYEHATDTHQATEALHAFEAAGDAVGADHWRKVLDRLGAFNPALHGKLFPGYAA